MIEVLNKNEFNKPQNGVVMFGATFCSPCKSFTPKFKKLSESHEDLTFIKVVVDDCFELTEEFSVKTLPTFLFFKNGIEISRVTGVDIVKIANEINNLK